MTKPTRVRFSPLPFLLAAISLLSPSAFAQGGTVFAWGSGGSGEISVPPGLTSVVRVAAADYLSLAVRANGTIAVWGDQSHEFQRVPANAVNVIDLSTKSYSFLALRRDGSLVAWGHNSDGETDIPPGATNIVAAPTRCRSSGRRMGRILKAPPRRP
jgi:hypothetical protein